MYYIFIFTPDMCISFHFARKERETDRQTETETDRQTERQTESERRRRRRKKVYSTNDKDILSTFCFNWHCIRSKHIKDSKERLFILTQTHNLLFMTQTHNLLFMTQTHNLLFMTQTHSLQIFWVQHGTA